MNADQHAAEAEAMISAATERTAVAAADIDTASADDVQALHLAMQVTYLQALTHAVLSLRPDPLIVEVAEAPAPLAEGELPTLPGAVIRAVTPDGGRGLLCRLPESPADQIPWRWEGGAWFADDELSDVEVLFPGVPS